MSSALNNTNKKAKIRQSFLLLVFAGGVLLAAGMVLYRSFYNNSIRSALEKTQTIKAEEIPGNKELEEVNKLITLPFDTSEAVYFGTIKNIGSLKSKKDFFKKAKNGDLLIVYPDQTIIYDPVNKFVVDIAKVRLMK